MRNPLAGFLVNALCTVGRFRHAVRFTSISAKETMDAKDFADLSKKDLIEKIRTLEEECRLLKKKINLPVSKYDAMVRKFGKNRGKKKKTRKEFDSTAIVQRKTALKICYFGWDLMGLQDNPGLDDTVEKILFAALSQTRLLVGEIEDCFFSKCGRTDKGVSAFSQVICLNLRSSAKRDQITNDLPLGGSSTNLAQTTDSEVIPTNAEESLKAQVSSLPAVENELDYCSILNRVLPREIRVLAWASVDDSFNARHSCAGRVYKYLFPRGSLNIEAMNTAAKLLIGTHDFRNFCKMNIEERTVFVRELRDFEISMETSLGEEEPAYQMCVATITGTGFLYHQVRYMMGILFLIGMDFEQPGIITELLNVENMPRRPQYGLMADYPLVLYDCHFENLQWNVSECESRRLLSSLQTFWCSLAVKAALAKSMINKFKSENAPFLPKDMESDRTPIYTNEVRDYYISGHLLNERFTSKPYKKVTKRDTGQSLEEKIANMESRKRRRLEREGTEPVDSSQT